MSKVGKNYTKNDETTNVSDKATQAEIFPSALMKESDSIYSIASFVT